MWCHIIRTWIWSLVGSMRFQTKEVYVWRSSMFWLHWSNHLPAIAMIQTIKGNMVWACPTIMIACTAIPGQTDRELLLASGLHAGGDSQLALMRLDIQPFVLQTWMLVYIHTSARKVQAQQRTILCSCVHLARHCTSSVLQLMTRQEKDGQCKSTPHQQQQVQRFKQLRGNRLAGSCMGGAHAIWRLVWTVSSIHPRMLVGCVRQKGRI